MNQIVSESGEGLDFDNSALKKVIEVNTGTKMFAEDTFRDGDELNV